MTNKIRIYAIENPLKSIRKRNRYNFSIIDADKRENIFEDITNACEACEYQLTDKNPDHELLFIHVNDELKSHIQEVYINNSRSENKQYKPTNNIEFIFATQELTNEQHIIYFQRVYKKHVYTNKAFWKNDIIKFDNNMLFLDKRTDVFYLEEQHKLYFYNFMILKQLVNVSEYSKTVKEQTLHSFTDNPLIDFKDYNIQKNSECGRKVQDIMDSGILTESNFQKILEYNNDLPTDIQLQDDHQKLEIHNLQSIRVLYNLIFENYYKGSLTQSNKLANSSKTL